MATKNLFLDTLEKLAAGAVGAMYAYAANIADASFRPSKVWKAASSSSGLDGRMSPLLTVVISLLLMSILPRELTTPLEIFDDLTRQVADRLSITRAASMLLPMLLAVILCGSLAALLVRRSQGYAIRNLLFTAVAAMCAWLVLLYLVVVIVHASMYSTSPFITLWGPRLVEALKTYSGFLLFLPLITLGVVAWRHAYWRLEVPESLVPSWAQNALSVSWLMALVVTALWLVLLADRPGHYLRQRADELNQTRAEAPATTRRGFSGKGPPSTTPGATPRLPQHSPPEHPTTDH